MTDDKRQTFWRAPSGRIHSLRTCSGGAPAKRMTRVNLSRDEFEATSLTANRCRCARWRTGEPPQRSGSGLPVFDQLIRDTFR